MKPDEIEALSFQMIDREAGAHAYSQGEWTIVRRMIHTSADFEYRDTVRFHPAAIPVGVAAIRCGKPIVTDTCMGMAGIRKKELSALGVTVHCLISDPEVAKKAAALGTTRARTAVDAAAALMEGGIYVVGNAPTALLRLMELIRGKAARPALVVGLPVGFVNAAESKEALMEMDYPFISNKGRKGGSNIAASVVNALVKLAISGH